MSATKASSASKSSGSTTDRICQALRERVLSGEYSTGMQLRQNDIANQFGVSHIPVREALQTLRFEGLVEQIANRGAFVASISLEELRNIWSLRRKLEPMAIEQAISQISAVELKDAENIIKKASGASDSLTSVRLNWEFHLCLYKPCGNDLLIEFIERLYRKADRYSCVLWTNHEYGAQAEKEHREILDCIKTGDVELAKARTLEHINAVERLVEHSFSA
ncbi:GntR family transcriptional regulator [Marinovum sp. 2_MG-2023]|uniref:GntR family transcriptional regulator n=1 Tax=unclassified Marinovum TaxID=2647166 RepID=UPI0026E1415F|nr:MULTISPECIES: GntR family transcriptional regulator [unclassified Marinovum]MDO6732902.1 GntR family transcriptional regulator [Marinovum sp. 2_MG-2023]MDO6782168.1 GntR family transcriptional regulator [Marinovum sp. 1_MG-2023]